MQLEQVGDDVGVDKDQRASGLRQGRKISEEVVFGLLQKVCPSNIA